MWNYEPASKNAVRSYFDIRGDATHMNWYLKRVLQVVFTVFLVVTFTFVLIRLMPGGPMEAMRAQLMEQHQGSLTTEDMRRINRLVEARVNINPDAPLYEQYFNYVTSIMTGDLGTSTWHQDPVFGLIVERLPWTVFLMGVSITLSFTLGITFGAIMAYTEGSRLDVSLSSYATFMTSVPYYVVALLIVYLAAYQAGWFPIQGRMSPDTTPGFTVPFFLGVMHHAALPVFSVVITGMGGRALGMRGNSVRVMGEDFVRVAQLRGLKPMKIAVQYVGRNAILPMYTTLMIRVGFMFGGAIILEQIFSYRGVGLLMFQSIGNRDLPLMMGCFLLITVTVVTAIFVADLTYGKLDPRVQSGERHEAF